MNEGRCRWEGLFLRYPTDIIGTGPLSRKIGRSPASLDLSVSRSRLGIEYFDEFVKAVTGITLTSDLDAADCHRIGNRLEAFVEEKRRRDEWDLDLLDDYPALDSVEQVYLLARFFRTCHEDWRTAPDV